MRNRISYKDLHPEYVKAAIRIKFGNIKAFHKHHGFHSTGVFEVLRGRPSQHIERAIDDLLNEQADESTLLERSSTDA